MNNHISKYTREYYENKLPFELDKYHKAKMNVHWEKYGMIFVGLFDEIYDIYIHSSECDKCKKKFINRRDRCLDHDHLITDDFNVRGVLCQYCNNKNHQKWNTNTGEQYICKCKNKEYLIGFCFRIRIVRNSKSILDTTRTTLEEAVECRNKFVAENPQYDIKLCPP